MTNMAGPIVDLAESLKTRIRNEGGQYIPNQATGHNQAQTAHIMHLSSRRLLVVVNDVVK